MRILVDSLGTQVQVQLQRTPVHRRLNTFYGAMRSAGASLTRQWRSKGPEVDHPEWELSFTTPPVTAGQLAKCDVFLVLTHYPEDGAEASAFVWSPAELDAISAFVDGGGSLMLMSNHANFPQYDTALAARFGITLHNVIITTDNFMKMSGDRLNTAAFGDSLLFAVDSLAAHDSCGISFSSPTIPTGAYWLVKFPAGATYGGTTPVPDDWFYSVITAWGAGKVIVVGNSGTVGDSGGTPWPSCGMVAYGNNLMFALNCLRILGGQRQAPALGVCPGGAQ